MTMKFPNINCKLYDPDTGACNHSSADTWVGRKSCIFTVDDKRIGSCTVQQSFERPPSPPPPPLSRITNH